MDTLVTSLRMNEAATEIADSMVDQAELLRIRTERLPSGARIIDAGGQPHGGIGAGLALSRICMGGLGQVACTPLQIGSLSHPGIIVWTDHPSSSSMASRQAWW